MRLHRFFLQADLQKSPLDVDDPHLCHQLFKVLRLREGDHVLLLDGKGKEAEATLREISPMRARFSLHSVHEASAEPKKNVMLYCSILKRENFEWVIQKATEVGVREIIPILSSRTVKMGLKIERLGAIAKEAAEQSGRGIIPRIHPPQDFSEALKDAPSNVSHFFFHPERSPLQRDESNGHSSIGVWIGPEGGWTEKEVALAKEKGFSLVSLGSLALRAETAAAIACYLMVQRR
jgi:16S rRNA (uracil1498-N3)-methyltransferase